MIKYREMSKCIFIVCDYSGLKKLVQKYSKTRQVKYNTSIRKSEYKVLLTDKILGVN